jgi:hypothetical protein
MLYYNQLTLNQKNTIDYNFDGGADWKLTGFLWMHGNRVAFFQIEETALTH